MKNIAISTIVVALVLSISFFKAGAADKKNGMTAAEAFIKAPASCIPLVTEMKRMDMVDYFNSGMDRPSDNLLGGKSRILKLTPDQIVVDEVGEDKAVTSISLDKMGRNDTVLIVISNIATPAPDGSVSFYSTDWKKLDGELFSEPSLSDWVVAKPAVAMEDIENAVPFVIATYSYDPSRRQLTLTANFKDYLPADDYKKVKDCLKTELRYKWNGKKMAKMK